MRRPVLAAPHAVFYRQSGNRRWVLARSQPFKSRLGTPSIQSDQPGQCESRLRLRQEATCQRSHPQFRIDGTCQLSLNALTNFPDIVPLPRHQPFIPPSAPHLIWGRLLRPPTCASWLFANAGDGLTPVRAKRIRCSAFHRHRPVPQPIRNLPGSRSIQWMPRGFGTVLATVPARHQPSQGRQVLLV